MMNWMRISWLLVVLFALAVLTGCGFNPDSPLPALPPNLVPYITRTVAYKPTPTLPATETPTPTPTPIVYSIASGDTLSKIAQRFGISLELLLLANPGIQPSQLSVGQTIIIPSGPESSVPDFRPTPVPADLGPVSCFPSMDSLTCFAPVHNPHAGILENVKVQITLFGADGRLIGSQEAALPLDILKPDQTLGASARFQGISAARYALSQLIASTQIDIKDKRYVDVFTKELLVTIDWNGDSAQVMGQVVPLDGGSPTGSIWMIATAYSIDGRIVGFRRWDWKGSMQAGEVQPFSFKVYSEGPAIDHVDVQMEARP